jgi:hypothetical protein
LQIDIPFVVANVDLPPLSILAVKDAGLSSWERNALTDIIVLRNVEDHHTFNPAAIVARAYG